MKILPCTYFPPIELMHHLLCNEAVLFEAHENFIKQSYRNRCTIIGGNGKLDLIIPVVNEGNKTLITEKKISYVENWQIKHWRAIESAYNNSPYFEYFEEEIKNALLEKETYLYRFNLKLMCCILNILRLKIELKETDKYEYTNPFLDLRVLIDPKVESRFFFPEYYQVFKEKTGFVSNLSILDLIFNEGLGSIDYLRTRVKPIAE